MAMRRLVLGTKERPLPQFILGHRIYRLLRDQRCANRSITSIAYDACFGDLSYFNRTFRRHYGATPSDIRNTAHDHPPHPRGNLWRAESLVMMSVPGTKLTIVDVR
jgi:AraC-like DNA-binding protein